MWLYIYLYCACFSVHFDSFTLTDLNRRVGLKIHYYSFNLFKYLCHLRACYLINARFTLISLTCHYLPSLCFWKYPAVDLELEYLGCTDSQCPLLIHTDEFRGSVCDTQLKWNSWYTRTNTSTHKRCPPEVLFTKVGFVSSFSLKDWIQHT